MGYYIIGDEPTVIGFRLAGVEGRAARTPYEAREALLAAAATEGVSVIVLTERLAEGLRAELADFAAKGAPLVIEVPDRKGSAPERKTIREIVKSAVGISV